MLGALLLTAAMAQDDTPILMDEGESTTEPWGTVVTGRTLVHIWPGEGTRTDPDDQSEPVDERYYALEIGTGFRFASLATEGGRVGGEVGWGAVLGPLGGTAGWPFSVGVDLAGVVAFGTDGAHADQLPVGLVLGSGVRMDVLYLTGLGTSGTDPVVFMARPFGSAEAIVHVAPFLVGLRAEYALPGRASHESFGTRSELRVGRYGGGVVFNLPF